MAPVILQLDSAKLDPPSEGRRDCLGSQHGDPAGAQ